MLALALFALALGPCLASPDRFISRLLDDCPPTELAACLQTRALTFLERAGRADSLRLWDSVSLVRDSQSPRDARALSEEELTKAKEQGTLTDILWDRIARFMGSHTVKIDLPKLSADDLKNGVEEGRGKMKKMMSMMMMAGAMKMAAVIPMVLAVLFLLAGKAFIISKVALILSLLITLKKLLGGKQEEHHHAVYSGGGGHGGGWDRRSFSQAHDMAFRAQKPS